MFVQVIDHEKVVVIINLEQITSARPSSRGGWRINLTDGRNHLIADELEAQKIFVHLDVEMDGEHRDPAKTWDSNS